MKLKVKCEWCGKEVERWMSQIRGKHHLFCSKECLYAYSSKNKNPEGYLNLKDYTNMSNHISELNRIMNPMRMNKDTRKKSEPQNLTPEKEKVTQRSTEGMNIVLLPSKFLDVNFFMVKLFITLMATNETMIQEIY